MPFAHSGYPSFLSTFNFASDDLTEVCWAWLNSIWWHGWPVNALSIWKHSNFCFFIFKCHKNPTFSALVWPLNFHCKTMYDFMAWCTCAVLTSSANEIKPYNLNTSCTHKVPISDHFCLHSLPANTISLTNLWVWMQYQHKHWCSDFDCVLSHHRNHWYG